MSKIDMARQPNHTNQNHPHLTRVFLHALPINMKTLVFMMNALENIILLDTFQFLNAWLNLTKGV